MTRKSEDKVLIEVHLRGGEVLTCPLERFVRQPYSLILNLREGRYEIPVTSILYTYRPQIDTTGMLFEEETSE